MGKDIVKNITKSEQIIKKLREMIKKKYLTSGEKFPSEMDLAKKFGTSQVTMNKITSQLVAEGLLSRKHGAGTFVNSNKKLFFNVIMEKPINEFTKMVDFSHIQIIQGILEESNIHGTKINFIPTYTKDGLNTILEDIKKKNFESDGFILLEWFGFENLISRLEKEKMNYVVADCILDKAVNTVFVDRHYAIVEGIRALKTAGVKNIAFIGEKQGEYDLLKYNAYLDGLKNNGLTRNASFELSGFQEDFSGNLLKTETKNNIKKDLLKVIDQVDGIFIEKAAYVPLVIEIINNSGKRGISLFSYDQIGRNPEFNGELYYSRGNYKLLGSELVKYLFENINGTAQKKVPIKLEIVKFNLKS